MGPELRLANGARPTRASIQAGKTPTASESAPELFVELRLGIDAMSELWRNLIPLFVASSVVPTPVVVTILLLRSSAWIAGSWVAGMTVVRLAQGALFGVVFSASSGSAADTPTGRAAIYSSILLILSLILFVTATRQLLGEDDPDAPPPKWMEMVDSLGVSRAFFLGGGFVAISAKLWVFTVGAIAAIEEANVARHAAVATYLGFVALVIAPQLVALALTVAIPGRARSVLDGVALWLRRHNRRIVIAISVIFGTWFLLKALRGLGVL